METSKGDSWYVSWSMDGSIVVDDDTMLVPSLAKIKKKIHLLILR
jgi:hypothetical protein